MDQDTRFFHRRLWRNPPISSPIFLSICASVCLWALYEHHESLTTFPFNYLLPLSLIEWQKTIKRRFLFCFLPLFFSNFAIKTPHTQTGFCKTSPSILLFFLKPSVIVSLCVTFNRKRNGFQQIRCEQSTQATGCSADESKWNILWFQPFTSSIHHL